MVVLFAMKKDVIPIAYGRWIDRFFISQSSSTSFVPHQLCGLGYIAEASQSPCPWSSKCAQHSLLHKVTGIPRRDVEVKGLETSCIVCANEIILITAPTAVLFSAPIPTVNGYDLMLKGREAVYQPSPWASAKGKL